MNQSLTIVIPCFDEQNAVTPVIESVLEVRTRLLNETELQEVQIIVVDDASTDDSLQMIQRYATVEILKNNQNMGYGASLKRGFAHAKGDYICFLDMDSTYPAKDIPQMLSLLVKNNLDVVYGSRPLRSSGMSLTRGIGNWFYTFLTQLLFGAKITDTCSGFRMFNRNCLSVILNITENSLAFSMDMTLKFIESGFKIRNHPIEYSPRTGESKLTVWRDGWTFLMMILRALLKREVNRITLIFRKFSTHLKKMAYTHKNIS